MTARLVYDGTGLVHIPPEMGTPRVDQMEGTSLEQVVELAGRICYDSLGIGRSSAGFHRHIKEVGHTSIWEHAVVAARFFAEDLDWFELVARKGVQVYPSSGGGKKYVVIAANLRAISEWKTKGLGWTYHPRPRATIGDILRDLATNLCPQIVSPSEYDGPYLTACNCSQCTYNDMHRPITLYLSGSRAWSHEMITHRYAKSQRSDRFCDASETEWVWHPDFDEIGNDTEFGLDFDNVGFWQGHIEGLCKQAYSLAATEIENKLLSKGVDRTSARKRARSAARGFLGHALRTDMIFTATASEWLDIIRQRMSPAADPEIAGVIEEARDVLRTSQSGHLFA